MDLSDAFTKRMGLCDALADFIHGLALGGVRRDGVTMRECPVVVRNHAAISQHNGIALNRLNLDEFAIDELLAGSVCLQQQLIASGNFQPPLLPHIKQCESSTQWEKTFRTVPTLDFD
jgi:hypothetical protein